MYNYGARYYAAWICRFVSVDPLQFEYPYYAPYQYAGNKPISYIDLDGRNWFYNEKTGDIYYNSHLNKGAEEFFITDGWKHLGEDNFFKEKGSEESVDVLLKNNIDLIDGEIVRETPLDSDGNREDLIRAKFTGENAIKFMKINGYERALNEVVVIESDMITMYTDYDGVPQYEKTSSRKKTLDISFRYIPKGVKIKDIQKVDIKFFYQRKPLNEHMGAERSELYMRKHVYKYESDLDYNKPNNHASEVNGVLKIVKNLMDAYFESKKK